VKLELVQPHHITTTAHLTIEGELDDISGSGQTEAAHSLCTGIPKSMQQHMEVEGAGHYGIFSGRRWRDKVYPAVRDFIASYQPQALAAATPASPKPRAQVQTVLTAWSLSPPRKPKPCHSQKELAGRTLPKQPPPSRPSAHAAPPASPAPAWV
jgi:poly(3-hydroxybutyrate) depolymerase